MAPLKTIPVFEAIMAEFYTRFHETKTAYRLWYIYLNSLQRVLLRVPPEFSDPPNRENVRPHSGNFIGKLQPHYSQPSRENVIPSSSTLPLAYYKEVPARMGLYMRGRGGGAYKWQFML